MRPKDYLEALKQHTGDFICKWSGYPAVYERHLNRYRDRPIKILEIGVCDGGSLQLWRSYFGPQARIIGMDINPACKVAEGHQITVEIGDQGDPAALQAVLARHGPFDIIVDDGSHVSNMQILSLELGWTWLKPDGVYICEDTHACYLAKYQGGLRHPNSFIEYSKARVDDLHGFFPSDPPREVLSRYTPELASLHFYDSMVVMEKRPAAGPPRVIASGQPKYTQDPNDLAAIQEFRDNLGRLGSDS